MFYYVINITLKLLIYLASADNEFRLRDHYFSIEFHYNFSSESTHAKVRYEMHL